MHDHQNKKMMWLMALCCAVPVAILIVFEVLAK